VKTCDYCGSGNEDTRLFCVECGTPLRAPQEAPAEPAVGALPPPKRNPGELNARSATIILAACVAVAVLLGISMAVIGGLISALRRDQASGTIDELVTVIVLLITVSSGIVLVLVSVL